MKKSLTQVLLTRILILSLSVMLTVFVLNILLGFFFTDYNFMQMVFADSFSASKGDRLFFVDDKRIFKLTDNPKNTNVYPSRTDNEIWNVDESGFRPDIKKNTDRGEKTIVILMIGDSFTYGGGISFKDAYPTILEKKLLEQGYNVNIINAGVPGYGPDQELVYFEELLPKVKPDIVLWNIYNNDVSDTNYYCLFKFAEETLTPIPTWKNNVYRQGYIVNTLPYSVIKQPMTKLATHLIGYPYGGTKELPISTFGCTRPMSAELLPELAQKTNAIYQRASDVAKQAHVDLHFLLLPSQRGFITPEIPDEEIDKENLMRKMELFQKEPLFDVGDRLRQKQTAGEDVFNEYFFSEKEEPGAYSRHFNSKGNALAAEVVYQHLIDLSNKKELILQK